MSGVMVSAKVKRKVYKTVARWRLFRQVQRRNSEDIGRRILRFKLPGRRPKRRLIDVVKENMKVTGVREEDAEDRVIRRPLGKAPRRRRNKVASVL